MGFKMCKKSNYTTDYCAQENTTTVSGWIQTGDGQKSMVFAKATCAQQEQFSPWDPADPFREGCGRQLRQVSYKS